MSQLGDRMKEYENATNSFCLDDTKPYVVRLDGHHFSRFLQAFNKPNDIRIHNAMAETTRMLVLRFRPTTGFTCSDEITLVFPVDTQQQKVIGMPNGGRIVKICTLLSGYASAAFYQALTAQLKDAPNLLVHVQRTVPHFDARAFNVPENYELVNNIKWRHLFDYRRNSISGLAHRHFSNKAIHGLHSDQLLEKLLEKGIDWHAMDNWYKWGAFVKIEKYRSLVWVGKRQGESKPTQKEVFKYRPVTMYTELQKKYNTEDESFILSGFIDATNKEPIIAEEHEEDQDNEYGDNTNQEEINKAQSSDPSKESGIPLTFVWSLPATQVSLAADFNNWLPHPMYKTDDMFILPVVLFPGTYNYKFEVDGNWCYDTKKPHVHDGFGGQNNVVTISNKYFY